MSLYKQAGSDFWWYAISLNGERVRKSTGTTDKQEATRIRDLARAELWNRPVIKGITWGAAVTLWVEAGDRSESDLLSLKKFAGRYKDRPLTDVTARSLETALSFCKTDATYTRYRTTLTAILNAAKKKGWITKVPVMEVRKKRKTKPRTWITPEQFAALLVELPTHMKPMATFAVETGLRQANVLGLTWDCVDLARKAVWIEAENTKGNKSITVPLSDGAIGALEAVKGQDKNYVFVYRKKPIKDVKTAFTAACIRAKVGQMVDGRYEGFTWHGFRHTWATWHVQNGTPLEVLQKLGGWADLRMVMNYAHHSPGYLASFANNTRKKRC